MSRGLWLMLIISHRILTEKSDEPQLGRVWLTAHDIRAPYQCTFTLSHRTLTSHWCKSLQDVCVKGRTGGPTCKREQDKQEGWVPVNNLFNPQTRNYQTNQGIGSKTKNTDNRKTHFKIKKEIKRQHRTLQSVGWLMDEEKNWRLQISSHTVRAWSSF